MSYKFKRADALICGDTIIRYGSEIKINSLESVDGYIMINGDKDCLTPPEARIELSYRELSDLEIVQKALEKSRMDLCCKQGKMYLYNDVGEPAIHIFESATNMLTWAKQTLGMEI